MSGRYGTDRWCAYICCLPLNSSVGILVVNGYVLDVRLGDMCGNESASLVCWQIRVCFFDFLYFRVIYDL